MLPLSTPTLQHPLPHGLPSLLADTIADGWQPDALDGDLL